MNATTAEQYPSDEQMAQLGELLKERKIYGYEIQRALDDGKVMDKVADTLRIIRIPKVDLSPKLNEAAIKRIVNYLYSSKIAQAKQYDDGPWVANQSTGFDPRDLYLEQSFRKLLEGMDDNCLTILVMRKGLLFGSETPAGVLAERYEVPVKEISTLLKRAYKHMKARQVEIRPFFGKRKFYYQDIWDTWNNAPAGRDGDIERQLSGEMFREARERVLAAGIITVRQLITLPKRQAAELLLGPDVYLPLEHFPRYVHVS